MGFRYDICVVGGCGHVGLPLALTFASRGLAVSIHDIDDRAVELVARGRMPFREEGAQAVLREVAGRSLCAANDPGLVAQAEFVVIVIGTPVDEHLNPKFNPMRRLVLELVERLVDGQCLIMRSTVFPGTTEKVAEMVRRSGRDVAVAFCPERVAEGRAMTELVALPQIVAGCDERGFAMASRLFSRVAPKIIRLSSIEAELTKVFANSWRYIQFATANQFFRIATQYEVDFYRLYDALVTDYPRMAGLPGAGFTAGPCLFKDTMQLAAADQNGFSLGHAAMLINEGMPNFLVGRLKETYELRAMKVGILGMAFKADSDDARESLSYKLRKILEYEASEVLCTDVYIGDPSFRPLEEVLRRSDLLIVGVPHREYRELDLPPGKPVIDIWNVFGRGAFPR